MTVIKIKVTQKNQKKINYREIVWNLKNQINIDDFLNEYPDYKFEKHASVVKNKGVVGFKIKEYDGFKNKRFLIYLLVIEGKIIKVGKCKNSISSRSYSAGSERNWVEKGTPSDVNYFYSKLFLSCLEDNLNIDFYCYEVPIRTETYNFLNEEISCSSSPYEEFEKSINNILIKKLGKYLIGDGELFLDYKE